MSSLLPTEMNLEKPTRFCSAQSSTVTHTAPDWEIMARPPSRGVRDAKVAFMSYWVLTRPRQLGPKRRIPYRSAMSSTSRSRSFPSLPTSEKPAVMMTQLRAPFSPASSMTEGTKRAGTQLTTMSTVPGMSDTAG